VTAAAEIRRDARGRPVLDLSGPRLTATMETIVAGAEQTGGVERWVSAIHLKASLFQEILGGDRYRRLGAADFRALCAFVAPARRRVAAYFDGDGFRVIADAIGALLDGAADTSTADARLARFCASFEQDAKHRWVRDLAAELLHFARPEQYPLMTRWVWDQRANTGVLREIWHHPDVDRIRIPADDGYETFLILREELSQFLAQNGVFRDMPFYVDLLCATIYAEYIAAQGGTYLRTDFASPDEPMVYARRMLGLDALDSEASRTRLKLVDGQAGASPEPRLIN
jgi:hypothetical protein